jgi:hypothetical protein
MVKSIYTQLAEQIMQDGRFFLIKIAGRKKPVLFQRRNNTVEEIEDDSEFFGSCREMLSNYLNNDVLDQIKQSGQKEITINGIVVREDELLSASKSSFLSKEVKGLVELLYSTKRFIKLEEDFLPGPYILPCKNGFIDFSKKCFEDNGTALFLRRIDAAYRIEYVNENLPDLFYQLIANGVSNPELSPATNHERIESFLSILAYAFIRGNPLRYLFLIVGDTASGKTTLVDILRTIFGKYGTSLTSDSIMHHFRANVEARPDLLEAADSMWIDVSELDSRQKFDSKFIKTVTGNDEIPLKGGRFSDRIKKVFHGKFYIVSNFLPRFERADDDALKDRLVHIDWHGTIDASKRDTHLAEKMTDPEMRARIFSWMVGRACLLYRNDGEIELFIHPSFEFKPPEKPGDQKVLVDSSFDEFVEKYVQIIPNDGPFFDMVKMFPEICGQDIFKAYLVFCTEYIQLPEPPLKERAFVMRFSSYIDKLHNEYPTVEKKHHPNGNFYAGIRIDLIRWPLKEPLNGGFGGPAGNVDSNLNRPFESNSPFDANMNYPNSEQAGSDEVDELARLMKSSPPYTGDVEWQG